MSETNNPFSTGGFMPLDTPVQGQEKMLLVIFAIDNTRSMEGAPISAVNHALKETISALKDFNNNNSYNVQVAIMTFNNSAEWNVKATRLTDSFFPDEIKCSPGLTFYSSAYSLLDEALSKNQFMSYTGKKAAPTIVFMTDGKPDDPDDVLQYKLEKLTQNGYFLQSVRSAILFGDAASSDEARRYMVDFTGNENQIYYTSSPSEIIDSFKMATIHTIITQPSQDPPTNLDPPGPFPTDPPVPGPFPTDPPVPGPFPTDPPVPGPFPADPPVPGPFPTDPPVPGPFPTDPPVPTDQPISGGVFVSDTAPADSADSSNNPFPADPANLPNEDSNVFPDGQPTGDQFLTGKSPFNP